MRGANNPRAGGGAGDYAGLLRLFNEWVKAGGVRGGLKWSKDNYVHSRAMCRAWDVRQQLLGIMGRYDMPMLKASPATPPWKRGGARPGRARRITRKREGAQATRVQQIGRAIAESLYVNASRRGGKDTYETLSEGRMVQVPPPAPAPRAHLVPRWGSL